MRVLLHSALAAAEAYTKCTHAQWIHWVLARTYEMATALDSFVDFVREKVQRYGWSHKKISLFLQENNPGVRGLSERSVRRFCHQNDIHKTSRLDNQTLDEVVTKATSMVRLFNMHNTDQRDTQAQRHCLQPRPWRIS